MTVKSTMAALGLAVCLLAQPAVAGPLEDGSAAYGQGDYATALQIWRPLAEQGDVIAQTLLGHMYEFGLGVPQDYAESLKWTKLAAERGGAREQYLLGLWYYSIKGVPHDYAEAAKWFHKAADQGYAEAQKLLGIMYEMGRGVPQDFVQAHMWSNLAATNFPTSDTSMSRDVAASLRASVAERMTPDQIAEAQRLAREWLAAHPKP